MGFGGEAAPMGFDAPMAGGMDMGGPPMGFGDFGSGPSLMGPGNMPDFMTSGMFPNTPMGGPTPNPSLIMGNGPDSPMSSYNMAGPSQWDSPVTNPKVDFSPNSGSPDWLAPPTTIGNERGSSSPVEQKIIDAAKKYNVPPHEVLGIANIESSMGRDTRTSSAGAEGVMQITPGTAKYLGIDPKNMDQNIDGGVKYYSQLRQKYGDPVKAAAAYNAGPGRFDQVLSGASSLPQETQNYITKFQRAMGGPSSAGAALPPANTPFSGMASPPVPYGTTTLPPNFTPSGGSQGGGSNFLQAPASSAGRLTLPDRQSSVAPPSDIRVPTLQGYGAQPSYGAPPTGANFMRGQYGSAGSNLVTVDTSAGPLVAHQMAAPAFKGFVDDLKAAGAPISTLGAYNNRNIAGTNTLSQHAYGNAIDLNQIGRNSVSPEFRKWAQDNPGVIRDAQAKWGVVSGGDWRNPDFGHFEWSGKPTEAYNGASSFKVASADGGIPSVAQAKQAMSGMRPDSYYRNGNGTNFGVSRVELDPTLRPSQDVPARLGISRPRKMDGGLLNPVDSGMANPLAGLFGGIGQGQRPFAGWQPANPMMMALGLDLAFNGGKGMAGIVGNPQWQQMQLMQQGMAAQQDANRSNPMFGGGGDTPSAPSAPTAAPAAMPSAPPPPIQIAPQASPAVQNRPVMTAQAGPMESPQAGPSPQPPSAGNSAAEAKIVQAERWLNNPQNARARLANGNKFTPEQERVVKYIEDLRKQLDPTGAQKEAAASGFGVNVPGYEADKARQKGQAELGPQMEKEAFGKIVERVDKGYEGANAAADAIRSTNDLRTQLDSKSGIFTGQWADNKLAMAKVSSFFGKDLDPRVTNTETFKAVVGQQVASLVKNFGSGTSITNADRDYAEKMAAGDIKVDETSIRRVLDILEKGNRGKIDRHNSMVDRVAKGTPSGSNSILGQYRVDMPEGYTAPARAPAAVQGAPTGGGASTFQDGQTATNPQTGQKIIFKGGQWMPAQGL